MTSRNGKVKRNSDATAEEPSSKIQRKNMSSSGFWRSGLLRAISDPTLVVDDSSKEVIIIKDKYPKAKYHYLVLPKGNNNVNTPKDLTVKHLNLLNIMQERASELIKDKHPLSDFKIGFHAKPSMDLLHLHVISKDFVSTCLKTKKHWNSFNTKHFMNLADITEELKKYQEIQHYPSNAEIEAYLKEPIKCNQCSFEAPTMPSLKSHLEKHLRDLAASP